MVVDFANDAAAIQASFEPYYERTLLSEGTDPALLDDLQLRLEGFHLFSEEELDDFARAYFQGEEAQDELYRILKDVKDRFEELADDEEKEVFRGTVREFVRLYAFLSQILPYQDAELERLYIFARYLSRYIRPEVEAGPRDLQDQIDMDAFGIRKVRSGALGLDRGEGELDPRTGKGPVAPPPEDERERLSAIIQELNDRYGAGLTEEDRISLENLERRLTDDSALQAAARSNTRDNVQLTFKQRVEGYLQDMAESNFKLYKRINDDPEFGAHLLRLLFDDFWTEAGEGQGELELE
jgi:type I restriction enzyme R subunit